jgi:DNA-binding winged helix-turn-helix (wHTH) protein
VPLIPRYFDLLVLLIRRRDEAVARRDIMDSAWSDVVVSDGALTQAVRSLRRALGDDPREPVFIRTVSRHGYQFVHPGVREGAEEPALETDDGRPTAPAPAPPASRDPIEDALERLLAPRGAGEEEELARREAAEALHAIGTAEALRRLDRRPGHEAARAELRDARWDVPGAGEVPLFGQPGGMRAARVLIELRLRRALRIASRRWGAASAGGALAGALGGALGGAALSLAPGSPAGAPVVVALAVIGGIVGGLGAAGVGAGLAMAEALARSRRRTALVALGSVGGGAVGAIAHLMGRWTLEGVFGHDLAFAGGGPEGLGLGAAAGLGYALSAGTGAGGGMAAPRGAARARAAAITGVACALMAVALTAGGRSLTGVSLNLMARSFQGSQVGLAPLARLLGEADPGPATRAAVGAYEGFLFGAGLALGLTRRPRP